MSGHFSSEKMLQHYIRRGKLTLRWIINILRDLASLDAAPSLPPMGRRRLRLMVSFLFLLARARGWSLVRYMLRWAETQTNLESEWKVLLCFFFSLGFLFRRISFVFKPLIHSHWSVNNTCTRWRSRVHAKHSCPSRWCHVKTFRWFGQLLSTYP